MVRSGLRASTHAPANEPCTGTRTERRVIDPVHATRAKLVVLQHEHSCPHSANQWAASVPAGEKRIKLQRLVDALDDFVSARASRALRSAEARCCRARTASGRDRPPAGGVRLRPAENSLHVGCSASSRPMAVAPRRSSGDQRLPHADDDASLDDGELANVDRIGDCSPRVAARSDGGHRVEGLVLGRAPRTHPAPQQPHTRTASP